MKALFAMNLRRIFSAPSLFIVMGIFTFLSGWFFYNLLLAYVDQVSNLEEQQSQIAPLYFLVSRFFGNINFLLMFTLPLFLMKSLSREFSLGSYDLLRKAGLTQWKIVMSQFLSYSVLGIFFILTMILFPVILYFSGIYETAYITLGWTALILHVLVYTAWGIWSSSLTENMALSGFIHICVLLFFWIISYFSMSTSNYLLIQFIDYLGFETHFNNWARGQIYLSDLTFYLLMIFLPLFLAKKNLELREI